MRILRHEIEIDDYQTVTLPAEGSLLSVAQSRSFPNKLVDLWSLDYEHGDSRVAAIYVIGTGNPMPTELCDSGSLGWYRKAEGNFLGTVVTPCGLVWHIFEGPIR